MSPQILPQILWVSNFKQKGNFHATYQRLYICLKEHQKDLDDQLNNYNNEQTHQGKVCRERTPAETLIDGKAVWAEKNVSSKPMFDNLRLVKRIADDKF